MNTIQTSADAPNFTLGGQCCTSVENGGTFSGNADGCDVDCLGQYNSFCASGGTAPDIANRFLR